MDVKWSDLHDEYWWDRKTVDKAFWGSISTWDYATEFGQAKPDRNEFGPARFLIFTNPHDIMMNSSLNLVLYVPYDKCFSDRMVADITLTHST